jgi:hypothetical protein
MNEWKHKDTHFYLDFIYVIFPIFVHVDFLHEKIARTKNKKEKKKGKKNLLPQLLPLSLPFLLNF